MLDVVYGGAGGEVGDCAEWSGLKGVDQSEESREFVRWRCGEVSHLKAGCDSLC